MDKMKTGMDTMQELKRRDGCLAALKNYIQEHPTALPAHGGEITVSERLVERGTALRIQLVCYGSDNAAQTVTHDCFCPDSDPEQIPLHFEKRGEDYYADLELVLDTPGNTRIEYWANKEKMVRCWTPAIWQ